MSSAMKKLLKDREAGHVGSLVSDIVKRQKTAEKNLVSFPKLLTDAEKASLNLTFVKHDGNGDALYQNSLEDDDDDRRYTCNDALLMKWMVHMCDWDNLKQDFIKRGIRVTGPDRNAIMLRGIEVFSKM